MNDSMRVKVLNSIADLDNITLNLKLVESSSPSEKFIKGLTLTQLKNNVNIFSIFKEVLEANNVRMM
jgi:hypothetical protein